MCIVCNPEFSNAIRALSFKSRRDVLCAAAAATAGAFVAEAVGRRSPTARSTKRSPPALRRRRRRYSSPERSSPWSATIRTQPRSRSRASRIVAVGSLDEVKAALGGVRIGSTQTFADKVVMPGLIDQHLHPILGALTLAIEVIATEDWVLPGGTRRRR